MKRGYKRLLIFEIIIMIILILNSFVSSILSDYGMIAFLLLVCFLFKFLFGFEKDRHRFAKDIIIEEIVFLLTYFLIYYLLGILFGFAKTNYLFYIKNSFTYIIPIVLIVIIKEFLRYMMLVKSEGSKLLVVMTCVLFILIDITGAVYYNNFSSNYDTFMFFSLSLLPSISTNIVCTYVSVKVGYKPVIFYLLVMRLYPYLLPIVPNPNNYITAIISLIVPVIFGYRVYLSFLKQQDEDVTRDYNKRSFVPLIISSLIVTILIYFVSGYFHYYAVAIASGSMVPSIHKGDVVIVEKVDNVEDIKEGQVIAYESNKITIVHRVIDKIKVDDEWYFYTKGDANEDKDDIVVKKDMINGTVSLKIPWIGAPTVWFNELSK